MKKIICLIFGHKWSEIKQHFYCAEVSWRTFRKMWQEEKTCQRCGKKVVPDWFNKNWRERNSMACFLDGDEPLNLSFAEREAFRRTKELLTPTKGINHYE